MTYEKVIVAMSIILLIINTVLLINNIKQYSVLCKRVAMLEYRISGIHRRDNE